MDFEMDYEREEQKILSLLEETFEIHEFSSPKDYYILPNGKFIVGHPVLNKEVLEALGCIACTICNNGATIKLNDKQPTEEQFESLGVFRNHIHRVLMVYTYDECFEMQSKIYCLSSKVSSDDVIDIVRRFYILGTFMEI